MQALRDENIWIRGLQLSLKSVEERPTLSSLLIALKDHDFPICGITWLFAHKTGAD